MPTEAGLKLKLNMKHKLALSASKNTRRSRNAEISSDKDKSHSRENGSKGHFRERVRTKETKSGEDGRVGKFGEVEKPRPSSFNGRKKGVYAKEETGQNAESYKVKEASKRKALSKKGEKKVKGEYVSEVMNTSPKVKVKEEHVRLPKFKQIANAKEAAKKESVMTDGNGTSFSKKRREQKSDFSKDKSLNVVPPSSSTKKKARVKAGLDDDVEITNEQPRKRKRVIKIDPYDISNKRLDDGIVIGGW